MDPASFHVPLHARVDAVGKDLADSQPWLFQQHRASFFGGLYTPAACFTTVPLCLAPFPHRPGEVKEGTTQLGPGDDPVSQRAEPAAALVYSTVRAKSRIPAPAPAFQASCYYTWKRDNLAAGAAPGHKN